MAQSSLRSAYNEPRDGIDTVGVVMNRYLAYPKTLILIWVALIGVVTPIALAGLGRWVMADQTWSCLALHALIEGAGVLLYLSLAVYIWVLVNAALLPVRFQWAASGFLAMAVIGGVHGSVPPGETFVGLHSVGVLIGGGLFALIAAPLRFHHQAWWRWLPYLSVLLGCGVSGALLMADSHQMSMLAVDGGFSETAMTFNTLGALGFLVATLFLLFGFQPINDQHWMAQYFMAIMALLYAVSGLLFEYSVLWDSTWWLWHFLRFVALSLLLFYFFAWFYQQTEQTRQNEKKLKSLAFYDNLTQLPNRALFQQTLPSRLAEVKQTQASLALFFIDLDRFKQVNDALGHDVGDRLLVLVAERMQHHLRQTDLVARMGGDEFTVILTDHPTQAGVEKVAQHLLEVLTPTYQISGHSLEIGVSIGIAFYPKDAQTTQDLMRMADQAMYQAKAAGGNQYHCA